MTNVNSPPTPIAIAVVQHNGHFLIGRRGPDTALAGLWEFPGGKLLPGETPRAAAVRECLEETGLVVQVVRDYPLREYQYQHDHVLLHFHGCSPADPRHPPRDPFRWVARDELSQYEFPEGNAELLEQLIVDR
jgi:mutator protein MutT